MAYQAKLYGRLYHNLYHLVSLYQRAKEDVGKNQASKGEVECFLQNYGIINLQNYR
jgi:hypothetical protein